jgi:hypothetical protein
VYRLIALLCLCSVTAPVLAENLRCGSHIVSKGDSALVLRQRCGAPTQVDRYENKSAVQRYDRLANTYITEQLADPYEIWTYNFGPRRLIARVTVRGGLVKSIVTGGRGF